MGSTRCFTLLDIHTFLVAMTRAKRHLVSGWPCFCGNMFIHVGLQCVVGDSSTVQHGSGYLKKWLAWLEANADVRFAEI